MGAAINTRESAKEAVKKLVAAGADVLVIVSDKFYFDLVLHLVVDISLSLAIVTRRFPLI